MVGDLVCTFIIWGGWAYVDVVEIPTVLGMVAALFSIFLLFLGAVLVLLLTPGPNMAFVLTSGAAYGWRGGVAAAVGIGVVDLIFTLICAFGLAGLLSAYPAAFDAIRWAGAAYLLYLAMMCIRAAGQSVNPHSQPIEPSRWAIFLRRATGSGL